VLFGVFFVDWNGMTFVVFNGGDGWIMTTTDLAFFLYLLTPTVDGLIALIVVRQYNAACKNILGKMKNYIGFAPKISPTPVRINSNRIPQLKKQNVRQ
jgi:hypothetical protein